jgi:ribonuclease HII
MTVAEPRLTLERRLLREHAIVIACDEVGRGALAGPVAVGAAVIDAPRSRKRIPQGLRDSKLVPEPKRADVASRAASWVSASAVGWASSAEIDEIGIMRALGLAALRAIADLRAHGVVPEEAIVILDGNYDYISPAGAWGLRVRPVIKADRDCASAAAASVIARWRVTPS